MLLFLRFNGGQHIFRRKTDAAFAEKPQFIKQVVRHKMFSQGLKNYIILIPASVGAGDQFTVTLFCDPLAQYLFDPAHPCVQPGLCFFGAIVGCPIAGQTIVFQPLGYFFAEFCVAQCDTPFKNPSTAQTSPSGHLSGACHPAGHPGYPAGPCRFHPVSRFR